MSNEPVGVLIIGAGASGGAFAWSIADTGTSVLCLEQGPWMHQKDYPTNNLDWESRAMGPFASNPNVRGLPQDYPVNDSASPIQPLMFNAVGGSTILWAAHFPRFTPGDFRAKSDDGVAVSRESEQRDQHAHQRTEEASTAKPLHVGLLVEELDGPLLHF